MQRERKEEDGGGRRKTEVDGGGRRRKEEDGGRREEEGRGRRRKEEDEGGGGGATHMMPPSYVAYDDHVRVRDRSSSVPIANHSHKPAAGRDTYHYPGGWGSLRLSCGDLLQFQLRKHYQISREC